MPTFQWIPSFEIGHEEIDRQHRELVSEVALIDGELIAGNFEAANTKCHAVRNNLESHFRYEERFLMDHGFPRLRKHVESHSSALQNIEDIVAECCENCQAGLKLGCTARFYAVVFRDVLLADLDFKSYLQDRGVVPSR